MYRLRIISRSVVLVHTSITLFSSISSMTWFATVTDKGEPIHDCGKGLLVMDTSESQESGIQTELEPWTMLSTLRHVLSSNVSSSLRCFQATSIASYIGEEGHYVEMPSFNHSFICKCQPHPLTSTYYMHAQSHTSFIPVSFSFSPFRDEVHNALWWY